MTKEVNYKIAKLLKEKGFDEYCKLCVEDGDEKPLPFDSGNIMHRNSLHPYYSAPTIAEVIMWLYEKYEIWTAVELIDNSRTFHFKYSITTSNNREYHDEDCFDMAKIIYSDSKEKFNGPTEAYLSAITHVLNNLI